jgi:hypothetical protein
VWLRSLDSEDFRFWYETDIAQVLANVSFDPKRTPWSRCPGAKFQGPWQGLIRLAKLDLNQRAVKRVIRLGFRSETVPYLGKLAE